MTDDAQLPICTVSTLEDVADAANAQKSGSESNWLVGGAFPESGNSGGRVTSEPCMLGVDEAGRGPTLGPMVYGIAFCPLTELDSLKRLGCADSKTLTEEKREAIFEKMIEDEGYTDRIGWMVDVISPVYISDCMTRRFKCSLNEVSMNSAITLIKQAENAGVNIAEIYVDTVGPPEKYQAKLLQIFPNYKITVAKKADSTYPIVSAASIAAKVTRDRCLKLWKFVEDIRFPQSDYGSGYPGDPVTKKFIKDQIDPVFGYPRLVRFSWATADLALKENAYNFDWGEDDNEDEHKKKKIKNDKSNMKISSFFSPPKNKDGPPKKKRHVFFTERLLSVVDDF